MKLFSTLFLGWILLWGGSSLAQSTPEALDTLDIGYLEGRIESLDEDRAWVRLANGERIEAQIGITNLGGAEETNENLKFNIGQAVELYFSPGPSGERVYVISDWVRRPSILYLIALFLVVSTVVARFKGLRAFLATAISLVIVMQFILRFILLGYNPVLISLLGIGTILIFAIYFVHGLSWSTTAAVIGTFVSVVATLFLALFFANLAHFTGFGSEEALYINIAAEEVNLRGLMLAGLLIGALGALTDITIVQASVVRELAHLDPSLRARDLYTRAMNVGRDHVGSLVNTLVLAYTGSALPLLLLLQLYQFSLARALNLELVASEIIHTLVGSIGLVLAVPLTTIIAANMFKGNKLPLKAGELGLGHSHQH